MKCPFLKKSVYECCGNTGNGYPNTWKEFVNFDDCIGEECAACGKTPDRNGAAILYCKLVHNQNLLKDDFYK